MPDVLKRARCGRDSQPNVAAEVWLQVLAWQLARLLDTVVRLQGLINGAGLTIARARGRDAML